MDETEKISDSIRRMDPSNTVLGEYRQKKPDVRTAGTIMEDKPPI